MYLPLSPEQAPRKPVAIDADATTEDSGTVLVVEDDPQVLDLAKTILTRLGFTVLTASDGIEAMEVFRLRQADIRAVVCDLTMPRMNGWETLAALRALVPNIPVVLTSGYDEAQVMEDSRSERPQVFLQKPFKREELRLALQAALKAATP